MAAGSGQAYLRHTKRPAESCFLPDLTRFTGFRRTGPDRQRRRHPWRLPTSRSPLWRAALD